MDSYNLRDIWRPFLGFKSQGFSSQFIEVNNEDIEVLCFSFRSRKIGVYLVVIEQHTAFWVVLIPISLASVWTEFWNFIAHVICFYFLLFPSPDKI